MRDYGDRLDSGKPAEIQTDPLPIFALGSLLPLLWLWKTPSLPDLGLVMGLGLTGGLGQYLLFEGFRHAPASALAPVEYTGLIWAGLFGYLIWADIPGPGTIAGAALIAAGSLSLVWSERRGGRMQLRGGD